ncbi:Rv3235 family protein [Kribbella sp. C-35]|uniref:Rv3235 family protein n=1 Tax=Kribbella sp. C-35 TaxID=2789276 RepID=UPI00397AE68E
MGEHTVPATARYAGELTDGALALRLQAITRLGVVSAPRHLSSIDAFATPQPHTAPAPAQKKQGNALTAAPEEQDDAALAPGRHAGAAVPPAQEEHGNAANAPAEEERGGAARSEGAGGGAKQERRKLSVVPPVAGVTHSAAAPGQPDGARASLKPASTNPPHTTPNATSDDTAGSTTLPATSNTTPADASSSVASATAAGDASGVAKRAVGVGRAQGGAGVAPVLPEVRVWGARLAQAVSEVLAGDRPISQLVRFTDDVVFMELNRRVRMLGMNSTAGMRGAKEKSTVRSVRVFMPEPSIAEVAAHVRHGQRSRAVAFRLEVRRNRWVCTALELG